MDNTLKYASEFTLRTLMLSCVTKVAVALVGISLSFAVQAQLPDWLGGKPDITMKADRCMLYDWFLKQANDQTEGLASQDDLARKRVRNIANKLADYHEEADLSK